MSGCSPSLAQSASVNDVVTEPGSFHQKPRGAKLRVQHRWLQLPTSCLALLP